MILEHSCSCASSWYCLFRSCTATTRDLEAVATVLVAFFSHQNQITLFPAALLSTSIWAHINGCLNSTETNSLSAKGFLNLFYLQSTIRDLFVTCYGKSCRNPTFVVQAQLPLILNQSFLCSILFVK